MNSDIKETIMSDNQQSLTPAQTAYKYKEMKKWMESKGMVMQRQSVSEIAEELGDRAGLKRVPVEKNPFPFVFVDLTYRCNMKCNMCYNPVRPIPDMTLEYFTDAINRLPKAIEIRMLGGEPTIHPDFFQFVEETFKAGHNAYISTNGKLIARDINFAKELKKLERAYKSKGVRMKVHMDMSGGLQEKYYHIIHNENALPEKIKALDHISEVNLGRTTISAVLIRGLNEDVIPDLFQIADDYEKIVREVAFRSQGAIGRFVGPKDNPPYTTNEWLKLMHHYGFHDRAADFANVIMAGYMHDNCEGRNCCHHFRKSPKLTASFLEFLNDGCWLRGQLIEGEYAIEYMFESLRANDFNRLDFSKNGITQEEYDEMILDAMRKFNEDEREAFQNLSY